MICNLHQIQFLKFLNLIILCGYYCTSATFFILQETLEEESDTQREQVHGEEQEHEQEQEEEATTANGDEIKKDDSDIKMDTSSIVGASGDVSYFSDHVSYKNNIDLGSL